MNSNSINTDHLILRPFQTNDDSFLFEIQSDPDSMQFTFCSHSLSQTQERLNAYARQLDELGYAPWTVLSKLNGEIIGWGGLNVDPFDSGWGTEVAYFFHPDYWGRGYATELVQASIEHGFKRLRLGEINAYTHPKNLASIRVLEKCGFAFIHYVPKLHRAHYIVENINI